MTKRYWLMGGPNDYAEKGVEYVDLFIDSFSSLDAAHAVANARNLDEDWFQIIDTRGAKPTLIADFITDRYNDYGTYKEVDFSGEWEPCTEYVAPVPLDPPTSVPVTFTRADGERIELDAMNPDHQEQIKTLMFAAGWPINE